MFTQEEQWVLWVMAGEGTEPGSFTKALIEAIARADLTNFGKLKGEFQKLCAAVDAYQNGDLYQRWQESKAKEKFKEVEEKRKE